MISLLCDLSLTIGEHTALDLGAAHHDGVEDPHRGPGHQLRGRGGQGREVERVTEVVMGPLRPLAQRTVPENNVTEDLMDNISFIVKQL